MKRFMQCAMAAIFGLVLSGTAWAQQQDLEVTMEVVPANAAASTANEIRLPLALPDAASHGMTTVNGAVSIVLPDSAAGHFSKNSSACSGPSA